MERLGQVVIGFPGAGKTTYCTAMSQFLDALHRPNAIINLDPASETHSYPCAIDIRDLITLEDAMSACDLGPNGGFLYCMDTIERNIDWLLERIEACSVPMLLFDCPGQVELYTQETALKRILKRIESRMRLVVISLMDAHVCASPYTYLAAVVSSTAMMTCLEFPHINVLTKIDLLGNFYEEMRFDLSFYGNCQELERLCEDMSHKRAKITQKLAEVIEDFGLVSYIPLSVSDKESMLSVLKQADRSLGCGFLYSSTYEEEFDSERYGRLEAKYVSPKLSKNE